MICPPQMKVDSILMFSGYYSIILDKKQEQKCISAQGIRAWGVPIFLPDEFCEVAETEEEDADVNCCHEEYADARLDSLQATVGNQQDDGVRPPCNLSASDVGRKGC